MGIKIKIDDQAFNRGVDDALSLAPVRTAVSGVVKAVISAGKNTEGKPKSREATTIDRRDQPARAE